MSDLYRESALRGGIAEVVFSGMILGGLLGRGFSEDQPSMALSNPLYDGYWESKRADLEAIEVPAYVTASWTNLLHSRGTLEGWRRMSSERKWLRVNNTHEWHDFYRPSSVEDLRRFFDHVLKGLDNGWDATPRVRLSMLDPGGDDTVGRAETDFPPARTEHRRLHLDVAGGVLSHDPVSEPAQVAYEPGPEGVVLRHTFTGDAEITGYGAVKLWLSVEDGDDADVFVYLSKIGADGEEQLTEVVANRFHAGMNGRLRASLRELDAEASTPAEPVHTFRTEQKLAPGEVVPLEIDLWPYSLRFRAGESLQLRVCGADLLVRPEFPQLPPNPTVNRGRHVLHTGGEHDAYVVLPFVG